MSIRVISEIWQIGRDLELKPRDMLVLLALANYYNDDEQAAWPSVATLAEKLPYNERAIQYALRSLVRRGHISVKPDPAGKNGKGGRSRSTRYLVHPQRPLVTAPLSETLQQRAPDPLCLSSSSFEVRTTATTEAGTSPFLPTNVVTATSVPTLPLNGTVNGELRPATGDDAVDRVVAAYHEQCPRLPKVPAMPPERRKLVKRALKTVKLAEWVEIFKQASTSGFLCGENDRGWRADFDWFFGSKGGVSNAVKILEGNYDDNPGTQASPQAAPFKCPGFPAVKPEPPPKPRSSRTLYPPGQLPEEAYDDEETPGVCTAQDAVDAARRRLGL